MTWAASPPPHSLLISFTDCEPGVGSRARHASANVFNCITRNPNPCALDIAAQGLEVVAGVLELDGLIPEFVLHRLQLLRSRLAEILKIQCPSITSIQSPCGEDFRDSVPPCPSARAPQSRACPTLAPAPARGGERERAPESAGKGEGVR